MAKVSVQGAPYNAIIQKANSLLAGYSPAAMQKTAMTGAQSLVAPQIAAQNAQSQAQQALLSNLYNRQTGFSLALAQLSQPNADQARNDYLQAANTMGNLGQGITGAVGADWKAAADQAKTAAAGMTDQGSVQGLYDPSGLQSSGYTTNFALPGQGLAEMAVSAAADARNRQVASADQLGVLAANTQAQQSQASIDNARQLGAIRAQVPALYQQGLQAQQGLRQNAFEGLASLTGQRANYLQNAAQMAQSGRQFTATQKQSAYQFGKQMGETQKVDQASITNQINTLRQNAAQFGVTSTEQHLMDQASIANQKGNLDVARTYLAQAGKQIAGKVQAQSIANRANLGQMTGRDPATGKLMAGFILQNGQPVSYASYVSGLVAQSRIDASNARIAQYQAAGSSATAKQKAAAGAALQKLSETATKAVNTAVNPKTSGASFTYVPEIVNGQKTGQYIRKVTHQGTPGTVVPYDQTLQQVTAMGPNTATWQAKARQIVNARYSQGQYGRPYEGKQAASMARQTVATGLAAGLTPDDILTRTRASGLIPDQYIVPVLQQVRHGIRTFGKAAPGLARTAFSILGGPAGQRTP
jgi:hypothetical protein